METLPKIKFSRKNANTRTTFSFSKEGHEAIAFLSAQQGSRKNEVFDTIAALPEILPKESQDYLSAKKNRKTTRKTYVINKTALSKLQKLSKELKTSRDNLIETLLLLLVKIFEKIKSEQHDKYKQIYKHIIAPFVAQAEKIDKQLAVELEDNDPVAIRFSAIVICLINLCEAIEANLNHDTEIDPDFLSQD